MIIITIIILYFIQITHTDDFPSTGTRLVKYNAFFVRYDVVYSFIDVDEHLFIQTQLYSWSYISVVANNTCLKLA